MSSIYEKIEQRGKSEAEAMLLSGEEKAKAIENAMINQANKEIDKIFTDVKKINENLIMTKGTEIEQKAKQATLAKKKNIIDNVIKEANDRLKNLDDDEIKKLVVKMLLSEKINGDETLMVSKKDHAKYLSLFSSEKKSGDVVLDKLNKLLKNNKYHLKLSKDSANIDGGFIVVGESYDVDHSYNTMLLHFKEKYEAQIACILFDDK